MKLPDFISRWLIDYWRWFALGIMALIFTIGYLTVLSTKIAAVRTDGLIKRSQTEEQLAADTAYRDALQTSAAAFTQKISTEDQATIEAFIPSQSDFPTLLLTIQDIVKRAGLSLSDVSVTEIGQTAAAGASAPVAAAEPSTAIAQAATVQGVNLRTQDVAVTVNGIRSYTDVKGFVAVVESSRRLFDIVSISFNLGVNSGATEGTATTGSPITFSLRTYYLPAAS